jgi:hypothetical protein
LRQSFPLLALSLVMFAAFDLTAGSTAQPWFQSEVFNVSMKSGDVWHASGGDVFLLFSLLLLLIEILRSTRSDRASIVNHAFSFIVFVASMILFLRQPGYGNSTFIMFMSMSLIDVIAGFIITTVSARRDISIQRTGGDQR